MVTGITVLTRNINKRTLHSDANVCQDCFLRATQMCGILGTVNQPFGESVLNLLSHRGPDDSGIAVKSVGAHLVTLGQRRLSILDLSPAGHQPMWLGSGQRAIVFNG